MASVQSLPNTMSIVKRYADPQKLNQMRELFNEIAEDIETKIIKESNKRPLESSETDFLTAFRCGHKRRRAEVLSQDNLKVIKIDMPHSTRPSWNKKVLPPNKSSELTTETLPTEENSITSVSQPVSADQTSISSTRAITKKLEDLQIVET